MATQMLEGSVTEQSVFVDALDAIRAERPSENVLTSKEAARSAFIAASNLVRSARQGISRMIGSQIRALAAFLTFAEKGKVGNEEIATLLHEGLDSAVLGLRAQVKQVDGSLNSEWLDKTTAYKQYATKYKALARWQNKDYSTAEKEWLKDATARNAAVLDDPTWRWDGAVSFGAHSYLDPVAALSAGETFSDVFKAWKDVVNPTNYDVNNYETNRGALKASQDKTFINGLSVVLRATPKEGGPARRKATKLITVGGAIEGTILGLLAHSPRAMLTEARLDRLAEAVAFYASKYHPTEADSESAEEA